MHISHELAERLRLRIRLAEGERRGRRRDALTRASRETGRECMLRKRLVERNRQMNQSGIARERE